MLQDCSEPDDSQWAKDGGNVNQYFWYLIQFCPAALWQIIVFPRLDLVNLDLVSLDLVNLDLVLDLMNKLQLPFSHFNLYPDSI